MHGLGALIPMAVLIPPVNRPCLHEVEQDPVGKNSRITCTQFLSNMDDIPPEAVIKVTFTKDILGPMLFAEPLFPWEDSPMDHTC